MSIGYPHWSAVAAEMKAAARVKRKCVYCNISLVDKQRFYCSGSCSIAFYHKYYLSWENVRGQVLTRDGEKCVRCGGKAWEVHHKHALAEGGSPYDLDNLESLCSECHRKETNQLFERQALENRFTRILSLPADHKRILLQYLDNKLKEFEEAVAESKNYIELHIS